MHDDDQQLQDLDRVFGPAMADYYALRHQAPLRATPAPSPRRTHPLYQFAAVASVLAVIAIGSVSVLNIHAPQKQARFAIPDLGATPLSLRPTGKIKPRSLLPPTSTALRLPRRPVAGKS